MVLPLGEGWGSLASGCGFSPLGDTPEPNISLNPHHVLP